MFGMIAWLVWCCDVKMCVVDGVMVSLIQHMVYLLCMVGVMIGVMNE